MRQKENPQMIRDRLTLGEAKHIYFDHKKESYDMLMIFEKYLNSINRGQIRIRANIFSKTFLSLCADLADIRNRAAHAGMVSYEDACICCENMLNTADANKELRGAKGLIFELISITKNPIKIN